MAAKFASFTTLLLLSTVANVAEPVIARAIEGRQVVSSVATVPAGTTAVPSSANVITVSICQPTTTTVSSAVPPKTFAYNSVGNGTLSIIRVASSVSASSFFSGGPVESSPGSVPVESPTGSVPIESPTSVVTDTATNAVSSLWSSGGPAATYTPILATPTGSPTTVKNTDVVTSSVSSVFTPASASSVPAASVTTVYYDCGSLARPSVSPTSVEATATAVPTVSNIFSRE